VERSETSRRVRARFFISICIGIQISFSEPSGVEFRWLPSMHVTAETVAHKIQL
jgi:hypothetical protein